MSSAASTSNAMDLEAATAQPAQQTTTSQRTWTDWLKSFSFVLPEPKEDEETYTHVSDPREQHFGYQCSAAEEEAEAVYTAMLAATQGEDYSDIEQNKFLQTPCKDLSGRAVVLVVARYLPADVQDADRLYQYTCRQLDTVADDKYCVIYVLTEASYWENSPGILFLRQAYERLPVKYKLNLERFYILHSDLSLWLTTSVVCPLMSHGFWGKLKNLSRLEFLWDYVSKEAIASSLPSFIMEHDDLLEEQPLHDYGFVDIQNESSMPVPL